MKKCKKGFGRIGNQCVRKSKSLLRSEIDATRETIKIWHKGTRPYISAKKRLISLKKRLKSR